MHIGLVFDLKEDYGIEADDLTYSDFCNPAEIQHIQITLENLGYRVTMIGSPKEFAPLHTKRILLQYLNQ